MYDVFDSFISIDTWHTDHPNDEQRFYLALNKVVRNPGFNADDLCAWLKSKVAPSMHEYVVPWHSRAWAVRDFLKYTSELLE